MKDDNFYQWFGYIILGENILTLVLIALISYRISSAVKIVITKSEINAIIDDLLILMLFFISSLAAFYTGYKTWLMVISTDIGKDIVVGRFVDRTAILLAFILMYRTKMLKYHLWVK